MKHVKAKNLPYIPASHEDPNNPGVLKKVLLKKGDIQSGVVEMVNWAKLPKGKSFNAHFHQDMEEVFILLTGEVLARVGEEQLVLQAGDALVVPNQAVHTFRNISEKDVEYIVFGISKNTEGKTITVHDKI